ncbi:MAG TPA: site-2 protease family protein, partial [Bacillota bacterium]|nr:site-2 protease family protein [Bacillota bacterium]
GLLNLMPIPFLDGGWVLFLIIEAVRGKPLSPQVEGFLRFIGLALLMLLLVYATVSDISRIMVQRM